MHICYCFINDFSPFLIVSISKRTNCYPLRSSCSYLALNYYEEASNQFEEYRIDAIIPERCCLLNDVCYPLKTYDPFYKAPWDSVEFEEEYMSNEANKFEERILKFCSTIPPLFKIDEIAIDDDILFKCDTLFDSVNFKEQSLHKLRNQSVSCAHYFFLEVPFISFRLRKIIFNPDDLLKNIPLMELEDIFEKEINISFEDLEASFECSDVTEEKPKFSLDIDKQFEEIILPEISEDVINFEQVSLDSRKKDLFIQNQKDCSSNLNYSAQCNEDSINENRCSINDIQSSQQLQFFKTENFCNQSNASSNITAPIENIKVDKKKRAFNSGIKSQTVLTGPTTSNYMQQSGAYDTELSAPGNHYICKKDNLNSKLRENEYDNFSELNDPNFFTDDFFSFNDDNDDENIHITTVLNKNYILDVNELSSNICYRPFTESENAETQGSGNSQIFLDNISKLDIKNSNIFNISTSNKQTHPLFNVKKCTAYRDSSLQNKNASSSFDYKTQAPTENLFQCQKSLNLLSSFLHGKKRGSDDLWSLKSSPSQSQMSFNSSEKQDFAINDDLEDMEDSNLNSIQDKLTPMQSSVKNSLQLSNEDIVVRFSDDYIEVMLLYEAATMYYIQKLLPWEGFQFSPDLTIIDISLDKMRFLLNQETKRCRDRCISPLEGGIQYSLYVKLLILHGILKSLYCLIHFGPQLSLTSLTEFEDKHKSVVKGCFDDLIESVSNFVAKLSTTNAVHPKIESLCSYLLSKYYYCKGNVIPFKVLIIVEEHLSFFHSSFEAFMKTLLPEISIVLIPESCYLLKDTDFFRESNEHIYTVCVSSISKEMPWKAFTFVVEYESDDNECWKAICKQENVAHICFRLDPLPLKTLEEIKCSCVQIEPFRRNPKESCKMLVVVSKSVSYKFKLKSLLPDNPNMSVYERSYSSYLPHMHFADVTVNHLTCVMIVNQTLFSKGDFLPSLVDKLSSLQLKYEICWIIFHEDLFIENQNEEFFTNIRMDCYKFYYIAIKMKLPSFKVKFLFARREEAVVEWINQIISREMKITYDKFDCYPKTFLFAERNEEELFLMSFPSFNPIVVAFILDSKIPLNELMNLECKVLCNKFPYISERFLKHFHKFVHETAGFNSRLSDNKEEKLIKTVQSSSYSEPRIFAMRQKSSSHEVHKFISCLERCQSKERNSNPDFDTSYKLKRDCSQKCDIPSDKYAEMSVEEIDRTYRELLLQDLEPASFDIQFGRSSPINSCVLGTIPPRDTLSSESFSYVQKSKKRKISQNSDVTYQYSFDDHSFDSSNTKQNSSYPLVPFVNSKIQETYDLEMYDDTNIKLTKSLQKDVENSIAPESTMSKLDLAEYRYTSKRKMASNLMNLQKTVNMCSQISALCNPSRIQKGVSSETVCKRVCFKKVLETQSIESNSSQYFQTSASLHNYCHQTQSFPSTDEICKMENKSNFKSSKKFGSSCFSQGNVILTPRESHRLTYEKIPGKKGQTRLIFQ